MKSKDRPSAWGTSCDEYGDPSEVFVANRAGLLYLKTKVDEALERGEAEIGDGAAFHFRRIRLAEKHPFDTHSLTKAKNALGRFMLLALVVIAAGLMIYGAYALVRK